MLLPSAAPDGERYLFTKEAALVLGVAECTISSWRKKGLISPLPGSPPRKPMYSLTQLRAAEEGTRERAIAATGSDRLVQRRRGIG